MKGHKKRVNCVIWKQDNLMISGCDDGLIKVWATKEKTKELGLQCPVFSVQEEEDMI